LERRLIGVGGSVGERGADAAMARAMMISRRAIAKAHGVTAGTGYE
jgi:hypothetical protein